MTKQPFFSVIIPTLNEEHFLPRLLTCLKEQTFRQFEVIVVDGESEDNTVKVGKTFIPKFESSGGLQVITDPRKKSVSAPRNTGAKLARGTYFIFFDADVTIGPEFLQELHTYFTEHKPLLITTKVASDDNDLLNKTLVGLTNRAIKLLRTSGKVFLLGFNIIMERDAFWKIGGFDETVLLGEDHNLAQSAHKQGITLTFLDKPVLTCSLRRFRSEGRWAVLKKYVHSTLYIIIKGPIRSQIYQYTMGGSYHLQKEQSKPS